MKIPSGNLHEMIDCPFEARTQQQYDAVKSIVEKPDFDFMCMSSNPFSHEIGKYKGTFSFLYYTKGNTLNASQITPTGRIKLVSVIKNA